MSTRTHTLMFIDDDEHFVYLLCRLARKIEHVQEIVSASHGQSAIALIQERIAENRPLPTVIFVDVNMPVMNGYEFLDAFKALIEQRPDLKSIVHIVMLTSSSDQKDRNRAEASGIVSGYVVKQSATEMKRIIEGILVEY